MDQAFNLNLSINPNNFPRKRGRIVSRFKEKSVFLVSNFPSFDTGKIPQGENYTPFSIYIIIFILYDMVEECLLMGYLL